ncbi:helix-turn-helix transcriptional regulator [Nesterenkonia sphaerica]|uniref:AlpA family phage regulatory protein n=1 Tax=Nesterenkonia sphaerica TaxID=1804988 RepID=A0A5R9A9R3_9MICC|nr:AlpA family phage regulatory protein [Nesterenkonia sphaerica]TLP75509.1 AlpA family phage regulatory protein [Nesterenkonia sphaerica]
MDTAPAEHSPTLKQDQLRTIEEVAEQMRTTPSTIRYKLQTDPTFPRGFKLSVRRLWRQSSIDAWIESQIEAQEAA